ncbi:unnamed protein product [Victoria cruziana]
MGGGAWPFLVGGAICLVNSVNERDLSLLTSYVEVPLYGQLLRGTMLRSALKPEKVKRIKRGWPRPALGRWMGHLGAAPSQGQTEAKQAKIEENMQVARLGQHLKLPEGHIGAAWS